MGTQTMNSHIRKTFKSMIFGALTLSASTFAAPDPNFHIYLMFGQSNMEGQGQISAQDQQVPSGLMAMQADNNCSVGGASYGEWRTATPPLIRCYNVAHSFNNGGLGPGDYFGRTMLENSGSGVSVGLVGAAYQGQKIEFFMKNCASLGSCSASGANGSVPLGQGGYAWMLDLAQKAQQDGVIKGIFFHQGESNTGDSSWPGKVNQVVTDLRNDLGLNANDVPFIAGEMVPGACCTSHDTYVHQISQAVTNGHWVSASGLGSRDQYHFNAEGYREIGRRYAQKMLELIDVSGNGTTTSSVATSSVGNSTGSNSLTVRMSGVVGDENVSLIVGGTVVEAWTLSTFMSDYTVNTDASGEIQVEFTNDSGDRDVQVDYTIVNGEVRQAEDQQENTGAYDGSCGGGSYSEMLHCNGYIAFGSVSGGSVVISSSSAPVVASSSTPVVVASSSSTPSVNPGQCVEMCRWYQDAPRPLCVNQDSGWGWENQQSCIGRTTCNSQSGDGGVVDVCDDTTATSSSSSSSVVVPSSSSSSVVFVPSSSSSSVGPVGGNSITVRMSGVVGDESVSLEIGGSTIETWTLSASMSDYSVTTSVTGELRVAFTNDSGDRDVQVDYVSVNGTTYQAEDQEDNTGAYSGSCGGGSYSEMLHCDGSIGFGNPFGGTTNPGSSSSSSSVTSIPGGLDNLSFFVGNITTSGSIRSDFGQYWDQITLENAGKWGQVEPQRDQYNWSGIDAAYTYAKQNGIPYKQHTFVWGSQYPSWIDSLSASEKAAEIEEWISDYCARYPDTEIIDVVNESTPGHAPANFARDAFGDNWIIKSFQLARQYCPNSILVLNDYNVLIWNTSEFIQMAQPAINAGVVDAIGLQAHGLADISLSELKTNLDRIAALGLPIFISEYDIEKTNDQDQLRVMQEQFPVFYNHPSVKGITLWGYVVGTTWRDGTGLIQSNGQYRPAMDWLMNYIGR